MPKEIFRGFKLCKDEVVNLDVNRLLLGIAREANTRGGLGKIQGKIFFEIDGYNDDERKPWEIPEVRKYFKSLDEIAPFFLYFIANEVLGESVRTYLSMFIDPDFFATFNPGPEMKQEIDVFIKNRIHAVADYCEKINSSEKAGVDPRETIFQVFRCMGHDTKREDIFKDKV